MGMIPAEAVEAAAKGIWETRPMERVSDENSPNYGAAKPWADIKQYQRDRCMTLARFALEAAAPYMLADVERELADAKRMIALLVLEAGGKVALSRRAITEVSDTTVIETKQDVINGGWVIRAVRPA